MGQNKGVFIYTTADLKTNDREVTLALLRFCSATTLQIRVKWGFNFFRVPDPSTPLRCAQDDRGIRATTRDGPYVGGHITPGSAGGGKKDGPSNALRGWGAKQAPR